MVEVTAMATTKATKMTDAQKRSTMLALCDLDVARIRLGAALDRVDNLLNGTGPGVEGQPVPLAAGLGSDTDVRNMSVPRRIASAHLLDDDDAAALRTALADVAAAAKVVAVNVARGVK